MCAEGMWMQVSSQLRAPPTYTHPSPPPHFHSFLPSQVVLGFMAIDRGSETNGFWFLGQESLPGQVVDGGPHGTVLGVGAGGGWACGSLPPPPGPCSPRGNLTSYPGVRRAPARATPWAEMGKGMQKSRYPGPALNKLSALP